jgi:hypothetical protein
MWTVDGTRMRPLLDDGGADPPWHSSAYQSLPPVYAQNASLEMARTRALDELGTIAGRVIRPFLTEGLEGFDINGRDDWLLLERLLADGEAHLPVVTTTPSELQEQPT